MQKKKFLFVSYDALISDLAWQVVKEGHEAKYYIKNAEDKEIADGFVPKTDDWRKEADWADVIVFDDVLGMGKWAKEMRDKGKLVVGGTPYTDQLEDDRAFGQEELKKAGIPIIPYENFSSFDQAIAYVKKNPAKYVIKPSGEAQNIKRFLFVGEEDDGKDIVQVLEAYKKASSSKIKSFQLQKRVSGVEVAVGAFFNGQEFIYPINVNFEHKKLFPGNIGPSTGEMGTCMFWSMPNRIFNATLKKMEEIFRREKYVGYMDLNCIVNNNGIYPLEFTSRFGYPTIHIQQEGILMPMGEFLHELAAGNLKKFKARSGFQVGVRLVVPPFPYGGEIKASAAVSRDLVILFKKPNLEGVHIEEVKLANGEWVVAGTYGVVLVVVGLGQTMRQAMAQAYGRVKNIMIPNMYYRDDIGERWSEDSDKLHNWSFLRE
ncbi:phosphoribosylamine--glycine ligase [Patescibacteria group bacterium]|nr:phosphoribosylamine--glycine ligase [Patescibacteria group bacterium]MBU1921700.1 phosphoribosylamine--glycine ligase [Patescibacteria group bacterium]